MVCRVSEEMPLFPGALAKLANIACQTLLFLSVSLVMDNNVMADLGLKQ